MSHTYRLLLIAFIGALATNTYGQIVSASPASTRLSLEQDGFEPRLSALNGVSIFGRVSSPGSVGYITTPYTLTTSAASVRFNTLGASAGAVAPGTQPNEPPALSFQVTGDVGYETNPSNDQVHRPGGFAGPDILVSYRLGLPPYDSEYDTYRQQLTFSYELAGQFYEGQAATNDSTDHTVDVNLFGRFQGYNPFTQQSANQLFSVSLDAKNTFAQADLVPSLYTFELSPSFMYYFTDSLTATAAYTYDLNDYHGGITGSPLDKSGSHHTGAFALAYTLPQLRGSQLAGELDLGYSHIWNSSYGVQARYDADQLSIGLKQVSVWDTSRFPVSLNCSYTFEWKRNRYAASGPPAAVERDNVSGLTGKAVISLPSPKSGSLKQSLFLAYTLTNDDSNVAGSGFSDQSISVGYQASF